MKNNSPYGISESFDDELDYHSDGIEVNPYGASKKYKEDQEFPTISYDDEIGYGHDEYDELMLDENRKVETLRADLSCLCVPTCARSPGDMCSRLGAWTVANADQFISSVIVALALIPDSISYALIAGLPPSAALQSAWITNVITAVVGGRPGMITSASGLTALLLYRLIRTNTVVEESGIMFVPYVIMFAGALQCIAAFVGLGRLVSAFPAVVVVGMVNAMALLLLALQCRYAKVFPLSEEELDDGWSVNGTAPAVEISWNVALFSYYGMDLEWISPTLDLVLFAGEVAIAFLISMFLPKVTKCLPATLVGVLVVVGVEFGVVRMFAAGTPLIGDYGGTHVEAPWETIFSSKYTLPSLDSWESWKLILGYGCALFATQFTETAIALNVVDLLDKSQGPGFLVLIGQGGANIVSAVMGGMGGSGVVSMSVLADRTFGTSCLSTFLTGALVLAFVTWGYPVIDYIPLSAISGISLATVCSFIQWRSIAAMFTTCLPNSARDKLPPQFNIARLDVFIMLIVTAACLIVDVATLLFFVMAVGILAYESIRTYRESRKEQNELDEDAMDHENNMIYDENPNHGDQEEIIETNEENEVVGQDAETNAKENEKDKDSNLLDVCTAAIFPNCV